MSKTRRKIISWILTVSMVFSLFIGMGVTASANDVTDDILTIDSKTACEGNGWNWDGSTLTLFGCKLKQIKLGVNAKIELVGYNEISNNTLEEPIISSTGDLTIDGSGILDAYAQRGSGVNVAGALTINGGYSSLGGSPDAITATTIEMNGGFVTLSEKAVCNGDFNQTGGYFEAKKGILAEGHDITVSGGYMLGEDTRQSAIIICRNFTNEGGVVNMNSTSNNESAIKADTSVFTGGVTIASTPNNSTPSKNVPAIVGDISGLSEDGEKLFKNTGSAVEQEGNVVTSSNLVSVVIAKGAYSEIQTAMNELDGVYINVTGGNAFILNPAFSAAVSGGSYIKSTDSAAFTMDSATSLTGSGTLVCVGGGNYAGFHDEYENSSIADGIQIIGFGGYNGDGVRYFGDSAINAIGFADSGEAIGVNVKHTKSETKIIGRSRTMDGVLISENGTFNGGTITGYNRVDSGTGGHGIKLEAGITGTANNVKLTGVSYYSYGNGICSKGASDAVTVSGAIGAYAPNYQTAFVGNTFKLDGMDQYGTAWLGNALEKDVIDRHVYYAATPLPKFDDRFSGTFSHIGDCVEGTAYEVYDGVEYTFGGWYTGVDGTEDKLTATEGAPGVKYYAKWENEGKVVVTKNIHLSDENLSVPPVSSGIVWNEAAKTLSMNNAIVDCTGQSEDYGALGSGIDEITIQLTGENTIKAGLSMHDTISRGVDCNKMIIDGNGALNVTSQNVVTYGEGTDGMGRSMPFIAYNLNLNGSAKLNVNGGDVIVSDNEHRAFSYAVNITRDDGGTIVGDKASLTAQAGSIIAGSYTPGYTDCKAVVGKLTTSRSVMTGESAPGTLNPGDFSMGLNVSAKYVSIEAPAAPVFDFCNGEASVNEKPATTPIWKDYSFDDWYTGINGTGDKLTGTPEAGITYYANWTKNGKTVRTKLLDLSSAEDDTSKAASEGWIWRKSESLEYDPEKPFDELNNYPANTLILKGITFDTTKAPEKSTPANHYSIQLPADATIYLQDGSVNTVEDLAKNTYAYGCAIKILGSAEICGGGTLNVTFGADTNEGSANGIYVEGASSDLTISGGKINATGGKAMGQAYASSGIFVGRNLTITGGTINAVGGEAQGYYGKSYGIRMAGTLSVTGGTVFANSGKGTGEGCNSTGVLNDSTTGILSITGGTVTATADEAAGKSRGVLSKVEITSGGLTASGKNQALQGALTATGAAVKTGDVLPGSLDTTDYSTTGPTAKYLNVSFGPSITLTANDDLSTAYNESATKTLKVKFDNFENAPTYCNMRWCDASGSTTGVSDRTGNLSLGEIANNEAEGAIVYTSYNANAGDYYVYVSVMDGDNRVNSAPIKFTVNKINADDTMKTATGSVSDKGKVNAEIALPSLPAGASYGIPVASGEITMTAMSIDGSKLTYTAPESTADQTGTITIPVTGATNYNDYNITVTITSVDKTPVTISGVSVADKVYDGKAIAPAGTAKCVLTSDATTDVTVACGTLAYIYYADTSETDTPDWEEMEGVPSASGSYKLEVCVLGTNATYTGKLEIPFTIGKKAIKIKLKDVSVRKGTTLPAWEIDFSGLTDADKTAYATDITDMNTLINTADYTSAITVNDAAPITATAGTFTVKFAQTAIATLKAALESKVTLITSCYDVAYLTDSSLSVTSGGGGGGGSAAVAITVPVSGDTTTTNVNATTTGTTVTVSQPTAENLKKITEAAEKANKSIEISLSGLEDKIKTAVIPANLINAAGNSNAAGLKVIMPDNSTVEIDKNAATAIIAAAGNNSLKLSVETRTSATAAEKALFAGKEPIKLIDLNLVDSKGKKISDFKDGNVEVTMKDMELSGDPANMEMWHDLLKELEKIDFTYSKGSKAGTYDINFITKKWSTYTLTLKQETKELPFTDVKADRWSHDSIAYVYENNLFKGVTDTTFEPATAMTRGMLVTVLYRLEGTPTGAAAAGFKDVKAGAYYEAAVNWAFANGVVTGYGKEEFAPDQKITREQLAAILYRYANLKGHATDAAMGTAGYDDVAAISAYAVPAMTWAVSSGIINGTDNKLMPGGDATREQVAAILERFNETIAK